MFNVYSFKIVEYDIIIYIGVIILEYDKIYMSFIDYIGRCKKLIKDTFFTDIDMFDLDYNDNESIDDIVTKHRIKMIDIKLEHTMRMIEQIIRINDNLGLKFDLSLVIKVAVMYHDIGRIRQATWSNTFSDSIYKKLNKKFINHGEDGYDIFLNNNFNVDSRYVPIIGKTILHHVDHRAESRLNYHYDSDLKDIDIASIATGNLELNDAEWKVASLIVQLVADIDKMDILYQHLTLDFDMIRDYVYDSSMDNLDNISLRWGVSKKEILEFNKIDEVSYRPRKIKVPVLHMPIDRLEVPLYMKKMFYDNSWPELRILIQDENWHFITILWWRLSYFINSIEFSSILINIEESKLLEQIYEKIPVKYRLLVDEAFEYAKEVLVVGRIEKNKGNIYLKK